MRDFLQQQMARDGKPVLDFCMGTANLNTVLDSTPKTLSYDYEISPVN